MRRQVINYAGPAAPRDIAVRANTSLAQWSFRTAVAVAVDAVVVGVALAVAVIAGPTASRNFPFDDAIEVVGFVLLLAIPILWVSALTMALAAWADRDG